jgi:DUF1680 family protein
MVFVNGTAATPGPAPGLKGFVRLEREWSHGDTVRVEFPMTVRVVHWGSNKDSVSVIMPIRDRNGDALAAARVVMKSFPGQTEQNAIVRAAPVVKEIQARVRSLDDLIE